MTITSSSLDLFSADSLAASDVSSSRDLFSLASCAPREESTMIVFT